VFRLRSKNLGGYRLDALATFMPVPVASTAGGATIAASDIGVGITSIVPAGGVDLPRTDVIASGFDYDPAAVPGTNGLTPYRGAALGQATLADLAFAVKLISGPRIDHQIGNNNSDYLQVTMKFGVLPQYFTPATFTSVITLTISNGP
jgi:hypothetical protein